MKYYLGTFPTPGGDKFHLLSLSQENDVLTGTVTNSMGPQELHNCRLTENGFSADRPDAFGSHHYDVTYTENGLHLIGSVMDGDKVIGSFEADMKITDSDVLPKDPEGPGGPGMPPPGGPGGPGGPGMPPPGGSGGLGGPGMPPPPGK